MPTTARRSTTRGRTTRRFRVLAANLRAAHHPCCRCGQPIDYRLPAGHLDGYSTDHYPHPLSTHPHLAEDPANLAAAHLRCNIGAGNRSLRPKLEASTEAW